MVEDTVLRFGDFQIDLRDERLWRRREALSLPPKAFAVLRYLVEHPGRLVTKEDLFDAVWPDTAVSNAVLAVGIREIRKALGDDPQAPRFIETVHRRGYRFLAPLSPAPPVLSSQFSVLSSAKEGPELSRPGTENWQLATPLVGRAAELTQLHSWLDKALNGERQIAFLIGEPGVGKTALVEAFLAQVEAIHESPLRDGGVWIGRGQCIEHYGAGEPYLPVFAAFGQLARTPGGPRLREVLSRYAPTWLVQMPALLEGADVEALHWKTHGAGPERMLREMAEAVEALTGVGAIHESPLLVLVLEDLHWADYATLDLLSSLARSRQPARLLVLGTYRPVDAIVREHPLRALHQDLQVRGQCQELALGRLPEAAIGEYLTVTFPTHRLPGALARALHRRTDGNPLFLVNVVQDWVARGVVAEVEGQWELRGVVEELAAAVPPSLRQMIERQVAAIGPHEVQILEAASVEGAEFSAVAVGAGVGEEATGVEERCEALARREQVLKSQGVTEWPDGTVTARYGFTHALYQQVLYERVPVGRRAWLHQQIGRRLEAAYGAQTEEVAAELAVHFEEGREYGPAVRYLEQAARRALRRTAPREAMQHLDAALRLLQTLPDTPERTQQELGLQTLLAPALMAAKGYGASEVEQVYARVRVLCQQIEESPQLFPVLAGVAGFHVVRAEYRTAHEIAEQLLRVARHEQDPGLLVEAHAIMGVVLFYLGEFVPACAQFEQSMALYDPQQHRSHAVQYGQDPWVLCRAFLSWALCLLGYPEQALQRSREAMTCAQELNHPLSLAFALHLAAILHNVRGEPQAAHERAETVIALASEQGLPYWLAQGTIARGQALVQYGQREEGLAQIYQIAQAFRREGRELGRPAQLAILAAAYGKTGQATQGLQALAEAQAAASSGGERYWEAEVYRIKGELLLTQEIKSQKSKIKNQKSEEAEACFLKAIEVARTQQAKILELRAAVGLSRLWRQQGKTAEARQLLAETYGWFTEGFETVDLQEARALLAELS